MAFLSQRYCEPELMDQPGLATAEHRRALAALRRVNSLSRSIPEIWKELRRLVRDCDQNQPLRVLDMACGGGDVAIRLATRARRLGLPMTIHGCDISETALSVARESAGRAGLSEMEFFRLDVRNDQVPKGYDVVMCSLFLHHLSDADGERVVRAMSVAAHQAVLIDDLLRTKLGYALCWIGCRILSRSRIVRTDGQRSVRAAYSLPEIERLIDRCGLAGATVKTHWPERFLLTWETP
ncbi:MAG: prmC [Planctomycetaceae bacterium]|nr:prmC [Planctomycetaceae bacterium]